MKTNTYGFLMKIVFSLMRVLLPLYPSGVMNAAAPDGAPPGRRGNSLKKLTARSASERP
jgi:hypothetical protein